MNKKNNCCDFSKLDLSKCNLDMTLRECLEAQGINPEAVEEFLKTCCKK